jgi:hypothetical protein
MTRLSLTLAGLLASSVAAGEAITVDGRLEESAWAEAKLIEDFRRVQPFTLDEPSKPVSARVLSRPEGIAVGIRITQPTGIPRQNARTPRDANMSGDRVNVMIDFDGDGRVGYAFTVGLSGSVQDETITAETRFSSDWDGDWQVAVSEDAEGWTAEFLIPWSIAQMGDSAAEQRTIGLYVDRVLGHNQERAAWPPVSFMRGRFLSDFAPVQIRQYSAGLLRAWPYASVRQDLVGDQYDDKLGLDVFWKPSGDFQLAAALNPDFGQVEADELVVNFDAIETFFSDKRPFFTENQGAFTIGTPNGGQVLYTRRIGGPRDDQPDRAADIDLALKANGSLGGFGYGIFVAREAQYEEDIGRQYTALRLTRPLGDLNLGYLGVHTQRPFLDRDATVHAFDSQWSPDSHWRIEGLLLASASDQASGGRNGHGATLRANYTPTAAWRHSVDLLHYQRALELNDAGFLGRANLIQGNWQSRFTDNDYAADSAVESTSWSLRLQSRRNDQGQQLPSDLWFGPTYSMRDGGRLLFEGSLRSAGIDDLISRGNGPVRMDPRHYLYGEYTSPRAPHSQWELGAWLNQGALGGWGLQINADYTWFIDEHLNLEIYAQPNVSPDWLLWRGDTLFASFDRRQVEAGINLNWFPAERQEFRVKLQWVGIVAEDADAYRLAGDGRLRRSDEAVEDFSVNNFGLQLRYRWEFRPQSDLYVVYSRGGFLREEGPAGEDLGGLLSEVFDLRDADQFLVKVRYRL